MLIIFSSSSDLFHSNPACRFPTKRGHPMSRDITDAVFTFKASRAVHASSCAAVAKGTHFLPKGKGLYLFLSVVHRHKPIIPGGRLFSVLKIFISLKHETSLQSPPSLCLFKRRPVLFTHTPSISLFSTPCNACRKFLISFCDLKCLPE